jgi:uncharacterized phage protein (predicted DNA packaging)
MRSLVTLEKAKSYLRIDYASEDDFISSLIVASKKYLENAIGTYTGNDLTDLAQLLLIEHWYENRTLIGTVTGQLSHSIDAIIFQTKYCNEAVTEKKS